MKKPVTDAMKAALKWLINRGGEGVFAATNKRDRMLMARGERASVMHTTWGRLFDAGLIEEPFGSLSKRRRVTAAGRALDLSGVEESNTYCSRR